jgi:hypothetical protein
VGHLFLEFWAGKKLASVSNEKQQSVMRANFALVFQVPYIDDIGVNDVDAVPEGLICEVETRPQTAPVS